MKVGRSDAPGDALLGSSRSSPACSTFTRRPATMNRILIRIDRPRSGSQRDDALGRLLGAVPGTHVAGQPGGGRQPVPLLRLARRWRRPPRARAPLGTVRRNLMPKPSFEAARTLIAAFDGFTFRHRLPSAARTTGGSCSSGATPLGSPWSPGAAGPESRRGGPRTAAAPVAPGAAEFGGWPARLGALRGRRLAEKWP